MLIIWHPFWFERDRPISVGEVADFEFFELPPPYAKSDGLPVFSHGGFSTGPSQRVYKQHLRIVSIRHPELGQIHSIDTDGLDYTLKFVDGRVAMLNAEEKPGMLWFVIRDAKSSDPLPEATLELTDWRFYVETELV
jgi:hypothetical protein